MITAVVLAAGMSSRLGTPKQLLAYRGRPLICHVVQTVVDSRAGEVIVVAGAAARAVTAALADLPVRIVLNESYTEGQGTSVRTGVHAATEHAQPQAILFVLGDQPLLQTDTIDILIGEFYERGGIIVPRYNNTPGNPVIFAQQFFPELEQLSGDAGGRQVVKSRADAVSFVDVEDIGVVFDIDTEEDYQRLSAMP